MMGLLSSFYPEAHSVGLRADADHSFERVLDTVRTIAGAHDGVAIRSWPFDSRLLRHVDYCLARLGVGRVAHFTPACVAAFVETLGLDADRAMSLMLRSNNQIICFAKSGGIDVVAHVALGAIASNAVRGAAHALQRLRSVPMPPAIDRLIPRLHRIYAVRGQHAMMQTRLPGKVYRPNWRDSAGIRVRFGEAYQFLQSLQTTHHCENSIEAWLAGFRALTSKYPRHAKAISLAVGALERWYGHRPFRLVQTHGDFGFHNILFDDAGKISGVIDWDRSHFAGHPNVDAMHLLMAAADQSGLCLSHQFILSLWETGTVVEPLRPSIRQLMDQTACRAGDLPYLGLLLWLRYLLFDVADFPKHPDWTARLVDGPAERLLSGDMRWLRQSAAA